MKQGLSTILLTIIIVAVGLIGVYIGYCYATRQVGDKFRVTLATTNPLIAPTTHATRVENTGATTTAVDTANWKTYTNDQYGFSFKYPGDWTISTTISANTQIFQLSIIPKTNLTDTANLHIFASKKTNIEKGTTENCKSYKEQTVNIAGNSINKIEYSCENGEILDFFSDFKNNDINYLAEGMQAGGDELLPIYDQILSTFQFTK